VCVHQRQAARVRFRWKRQGSAACAGRHAGESAAGGELEKGASVHADQVRLCFGECKGGAGNSSEFPPVGFP
jgi:hypothetical protein